MFVYTARQMGLLQTTDDFEGAVETIIIVIVNKQ